MGFCRRCGDIVVGPRCKCGGTSVAPAVQWNQIVNTDRWSQTYVTREHSPSRSPSRGPPPPPVVQPSTNQSSRSPTTNLPLTSRVTSHITSTTSSRPPSPLKHSSLLPPELATNPPGSPSSIAAAAGILPSPYNGSELSKVYGSVLQPKESLATYSCAVCTTPFSPDATIYPDPSSSQAPPTRFLCRPCFTTHGGSRGNCPTCTRPVLILKSEGGFVENAGRVWHKHCFRCEGCFKNIGDSPMVDLMGRPCCPNCFDSCLNRAGGSKKGTPINTPKKDEGTQESRIGGMKRDTKNREGSPAIEELEQRLGIPKSRETSPALEELTQRLSARQAARESPLPSKYTGSASREGSPLVERRGRGRSIVGIGASADKSPISARRAYEKFESPKALKSPGGGSTAESPRVPTEEAIEEMKRRFMKGASASPAPSPTTTPLRQSQTRDLPTAKPPTPASRIPLSTRQDSISPMLRNRTHTSSLSNLRDHLGSDHAIDSPANDRELCRPHISSPRASDVASPTSSLSSLSLFRGHAGVSEASVPSTPDLTSDSSDRSSSTGSASPSPPSKKYDVFGDYLDKTDEGTKVHTLPARDTHKKADLFSGDYLRENEQGSVDRDATVRGTPTPTRTAKPRLSIPHDTCAKCGLSLLTHDGGRFVTVPEEPRSAGVEPKTYHTDCFRCAICGGNFREEEGQAVFVRDGGRAVHIECAPPEKVNVKTFRSSIPTPTAISKPPATPGFISSSSPSNSSATYSSSRYERPPTTAPPTTTSFPRFGSTTACPGCTKNVSPMEFGVVPGPGGTRWHAGCLVCGGRAGSGTKRRGDIVGRGGEEGKKGKPGCGKKLDSAAKGDGEGGVWCRECLLLVPAGMRNSPQGSPTRPPIMPLYTGGSNIQPQFTGTTTLARQFTGLGGGADANLMRQLTGGGLSPTRQRAGSPTKQLGLGGGGGLIGVGGRRPRPKSVIGMRGKSVDEGRGMFLVRQMTGGAAGE